MIYICAQPSTYYYGWQVDTMILSFFKCGVNLSDVHIVSTNHKNEHFVEVENKWSKYGIKFYYYPDNRVKPSYISSIRPHILEAHWQANPWLKGKHIFYHDCDIALTKPIPNLLDKLNSHQCYLSDTRSYIGSEYIESKGNDLLEQMCKIVIIEPEEVRANEYGSGGAQYLLQPGIDERFWAKVYKDSEGLFKNISERIKEIKNNRPHWHELQIWCADMWAVLWNLWKCGYETVIDDDLKFTWATNRVEEWHKNAIFHNAGVTEEKKGKPFYKARYMNNTPVTAFRPDDEWASQKYFDLVCEAWNQTKHGVEKQIVKKRV